MGSSIYGDPPRAPNLISFCLLSSPSDFFFYLHLRAEFRYFRPLKFLIMTDGGWWMVVIAGGRQKGSLILLKKFSDEVQVI